MKPDFGHAHTVRTEVRPECSEDIDGLSLDAAREIARAHSELGFQVTVIDDESHYRETWIRGWLIPAETIARENETR